jgi:hypothetical protein
MKKLLIAFFALSLTSCALWDAYMMAPYDANEYLLITEIRVMAGQHRQQCDSFNQSAVNAQNMVNRTQLYERYVEHIPRNDNGTRAARALNEIAQGLNTAYAKGIVSATFCRLKYNGIEHSAELIQRVTAGRPRK